ncbi:hypothetical protein ABZ135_03005 [Streptomyces sp. NPDC006339]|uniref:hypothetical protein n=1 Tax=Streptomyces sp. NPDC006339 TaxID=3156755 RepID=UPI0033BF8517
MSDFQGTSRPDQSRSAAVAKTAQEKASEGAGLVGDKAAEVAGTAKEQAAGVAHEATAQARDLVGELRDQLQGQAQSQTQRLAENVRRLADELREMSESGKPDSSAAGVVRQIADGGHQVASRLEERGPDGLVSDLQDFARRRPGVFLAGAALAGFAVARAGKGVSAAGSSSPSGAGTGNRQQRVSASPVGSSQSRLAGAGVPRVGYEGASEPPGPPQAPPVAPGYGQAPAPTRPATATPPPPPADPPSYPGAGPHTPTQGS